MKSAAFAHYGDVNMTLIGLGLFMAVFIGSVVWTGLRVQRPKYKHMSEVPLNDEMSVSEAGGAR